MRTKLSSYVGDFVLSTGWVTEWEKIPSTNSLRVCVKNPIIKSPNKHVLFEDLPLISKEDHLNFFVPLDSKSATVIPERYTEIMMSGLIQEYTRKDGSKDFGVYPLPTFWIEDRINDHFRYCQKFVGKFDYSPRTLCHIDQLLKPKVQRLFDQLESVGDCLPTFHGTYDSYLEDLKSWKDLLDEQSKKIRTVHGSRQLRRLHRIDKNYGIHIPQFQWSI